MSRARQVERQEGTRNSNQQHNSTKILLFCFWFCFAIKKTALKTSRVRNKNRHDNSTINNDNRSINVPKGKDRKWVLTTQRKASVLLLLLLLKTADSPKSEFFIFCFVCFVWHNNTHCHKRRTDGLILWHALLSFDWPQGKKTSCNGQKTKTGKNC